MGHALGRFLNFWKKIHFPFLQLFFFVNMGSNGSWHFKTLLLLQIAAKGFQVCPEFSSPWSPQSDMYVWRLDIFEILSVENERSWGKTEWNLWLGRGWGSSSFNIYAVPLGLHSRLFSCHSGHLQLNTIFTKAASSTVMILYNQTFCSLSQSTQK